MDTYDKEKNTKRKNRRSQEKKLLDSSWFTWYTINESKERTYIMSKVKQWAWDCAEKEVDNIINELKNNSISKEAAKAKIMNVENVDLCSIDENNVDEVIDMELEAA